MYSNYYSYSAIFLWAKLNQLNVLDNPSSPNVMIGLTITYFRCNIEKKNITQMYSVSKFIANTMIYYDTVYARHVAQKLYDLPQNYFGFATRFTFLTFSVVGVNIIIDQTLHSRCETEPSTINLISRYDIKFSPCWPSTRGVSKVRGIQCWLNVVMSCLTVG